MLSYIYAISFVASLSGLIGWFYTEDNRAWSRTMSTIFLGGFFVYLFALAFADMEFNDKLLVLFRDFVILAFVSQFFSFFRKSKVLFFGLLLIMYAAIYGKFWNVLTHSLSVTPVSQVDPNGELLVEIKNGHTIEDIQDIVSQYQLETTIAFPDVRSRNQTDLDDYYRINIPTNFENQRAEIVELLMNSPYIDWVEENEVIDIKPLESLKQTKTRRTYKINDPAIDNLWGFEKMNVDQLYETLRKLPVPEKKALVVILDTGVDAQHEDIKANFKSINAKYDKDGHSHGTHCAGIAAAVSNNQKGIASFAPNNAYVQVSSVQVLSKYGSGTQDGIIRGIITAADNGADVISMSLGGRSSSSKEQAYRQAVEYANQKGAIVVVAAGNSNMNAKDYSPANTPGVITVSAVNNNLDRASFSNYVSNVSKGIAAPGVDVYSTIPNNKYASFNGTSMATPYVAGLLGMMKAIRPDLTTDEAYQILDQTGIATSDVPKTGYFIQPEAAILELTK